jgi:hypothetical protein
MAFLAMVAPAMSQTPVTNNTVVEIPSFAPVGGKADHNTTAINDNGDVFVVWSASVYPLTHPEATKRRVEGAFIRRLSAFQWEIYPTVILGETDPAALPGGTSIFLGGDNCRKPDVVAVGNDFVVAWQRLEEGDTPNGHLECAFVEVPTSGDAVISLADPAGIGHILDSSFDPRTAGGMVDLAHQRGSGTPTVVASYVSRTGVVPIGTGTAYDFDVLGVVFDFAAVGLPPTVNPIQTMASAIAFDDFNATDPTGGRGLPDIVYDEFGNVVVVFEEFRRGERISVGTPDDSMVHVRRYSVGAGGVLTQINAQSAVGSNVIYPQRRPMLIRTGTHSDISLVWGERLLPGIESDVFHHQISYPDAISDAVITDYAPVMTLGVEEELPVPVQYKNVRTMVIVADPVGVTPKLIGHQTTTKPKWELLAEFNGFAPWRPALDVLEVDPLRANRGLLIMTVEGRIPGNDIRIFFEIMAL